MTMKSQAADQLVSNPAPGNVGFWIGAPSETNFSPIDSEAIRFSIRQSTKVVFDSRAQRIGLAGVGEVLSNEPTNGLKNGAQSYPLLGILPPLYPEWLGDRGFQETHGLRFAYVGGAMARGIGSAKLVIELGKMGALGMFGSAGLSPKVVEEALTEISSALDPAGLSWGSNLIHSPNEPALENEIVELYLRLGVRRVSA
jgi:trans-AT polyketide synthase/acyltransferase/oxidoreductase domain-containing protein